MGDVPHRSRGRVPRAEFFCAPLARWPRCFSAWPHPPPPITAILACSETATGSLRRCGRRSRWPACTRRASTGRLKGLEGASARRARSTRTAGWSTIRQRVGDAWIEPEWIADFGTAARAQGDAAERKAWKDAARKKVQEQTGKEGDVVSIELPVAFPESVSRA